MSSRVRVTINPAGEAQMRSDLDKAVRRAAARTRDRAKRIITDEGRVDTGAMRNSVEYTKTIDTADKVVYEVGSRLSYAIYQHNGVEGPIRPRRARVLRFKPSGSSTFVFAKEVKGFPGIFFLTRALEQLGLADFGGEDQRL